MRNLLRWILSLFGFDDTVQPKREKRPVSGYDKYAEGTIERDAFHCGFTYGLNLACSGWPEKTVYMKERWSRGEEGQRLYKIHEEGVKEAFRSSSNIIGGTSVH